MKPGKQISGLQSGNRTIRIPELFSRPLIIALLLATVTLALYWPVRTFEFLNYDDPLYYAQNVHVLTGVTWDNVGWAFTSGEAANWHPLTWLSLMLDAEFFGNQPAGPHLINVLWHIGNTVLLFFLLHRLTAMVWRSALVALLFAVHPLHVESVAWIAERKDLLCSFFSLLALLAYAEYVASVGRCVPATKMDQSRIRRQALQAYFLALCWFMLALLSKPMAVTLPFLLLLLDWWPLNRLASFKFDFLNASNWWAGLAAVKPLLVEKIPFFTLSAAASLVTFLVQKQSDAVATLATVSLPERVENAFVSYARYLGKTGWPAALVVPYPHPGHWPGVLVVLSVVIFIGLCLAAFGLARKFPFLLAGWFWFVGMLVPVIGLVQVGMQAMADRYVYLPIIGLLIIFVWGAAVAASRWNLSKTLLTVLAFIVAAACAAQTHRQLGRWRNDFTLFSHALTVNPDNLVAHVNLAAWFSKKGQPREALEQCDAALKLNPTAPLALYDLGNAFAGLGNYDEAIRNYRRALEMAPGWPNILNNLGCALLAQNQLPAAITNFEAALKTRPDFAYAHNGLATALFQQGKYEAAASHFSEAAKLAPDNFQFIANLGDALVRLGRREAAAQCYQQALQLAPGNPEIIAKLDSLRVHP